MHMCNILNLIITVSRVCICWWNTAESRYSATVLHLRWNQQRDKFKSLSSLRYGTCRHLLLPILQKLATLCDHQVATTCHFLLPASCRHLPLFVATKLQMPVTVICHQVADASHFLLPPSCGHLALSAATKLRMTVTFCCHQVAGACHFLLPPSCRHLTFLLPPTCRCLPNFFATKLQTPANFFATKLQAPANFFCHQVADTCHFLLPSRCRRLPLLEGSSTLPAPLISGDGHALELWHAGDWAGSQVCCMETVGGGVNLQQATSTNSKIFNSPKCFWHLLSASRRQQKEGKVLLSSVLSKWGKRE